MENRRLNRGKKEIYLNGIKIKIEMPEEEIKKLPERIESTIRIRDKEVKPISARTIFL